MLLSDKIAREIANYLAGLLHQRRNHSVVYAHNKDSLYAQTRQTLSALISLSPLKGKRKKRRGGNGREKKRNRSMRGKRRGRRVKRSLMSFLD